MPTHDGADQLHRNHLLSVTNIQVADALAEQGFEIDRKLIVIKDPVKEVGNYTALVKLHKEISVEVPFEVVSE